MLENAVRSKEPADDEQPIEEGSDGSAARR
jgi:hypothetical protein